MIHLCQKFNIKNEVVFEGSKLFSETISYYKESDFSFVPGEFEGWCKVINESWRYGVIPIVTSLGNTSYPIFFSNGAGVIYDDNFCDFNQKLLQAINMTESKIKIIQNKGLITNKKIDLKITFKPSLLAISGLRDVKNQIRHHFLTPGNRFPARSVHKMTVS